MSIFGNNITISETHFIGAIPVDIIPFKKLKKVHVLMSPSPFFNCKQKGVHVLALYISLLM